MHYRRIIFLLAGFIIGCGIPGGSIELVNGITWYYYGIQDSCLSMNFCDVTIRGDLHVEFRENGILVSKWEADKRELQYYFVDMERLKVIRIGRIMDKCSIRKFGLNVVRKSYHLSTLVGQNKIDSERESFELECNNLKHSLTHNLRYIGGCK